MCAKSTWFGADVNHRVEIQHSVVNINLLSSMETIKTLQGLVAGRMEALGLFPRKAVEHLAMLAVLWFIYSSYVKASLVRTACPEVKFDAAFMLGMAKFAFFTGWPFALIAFLDREWSDRDAGMIFLAVYAATNLYWVNRFHCSICPYAAPFQLLPYVFGALIGHKAGLWGRPSRLEG